MTENREGNSKMITNRGRVVAMLACALMLGGVAATCAPPVPVAAVTTVSAAGAITISGVDAHDSTVRKLPDGTYAMYGTRYGCGFQWGVNGTPFCGFSAYTAPALVGPWTLAGPLFSPAGTDSTSARTWQSVCGTTGRGCFNPRMIQRPDGVWILWFNAPGVYVAGGQFGAYYVMGCNGPLGPCGDAAGLPHGSTHRPTLSACNHADGDFSIMEDGPTAVIVCTAFGQTINLEVLDQWWANGSAANLTGVAGLTNVEGPGLLRATDGTYVLTYSDPYCGYCAGTGAGYAVSVTGVTGTWHYPANVAAGGPVPAQRRDFLPSSCGGQPRTVVALNGQSYQLIDNWYGSPNETNAATTLVPLVVAPPYLEVAAGAPMRSGVTGSC